MAIARVVGMVCCLLGLVPGAPMAYAATGKDLFTQGVGAFKRGNFAGALGAFRKAAAAGLDTPALHYNLGSTLYKLGRYAEAEAAFRACIRDPKWAALAHYNMGLAAYQRGERTQAARYFERAEATADSDEVRALARAMRERLDPPGRPRTGVITLSAGYNDNVTLTADGQTLQTARASDAFAELWASTSGSWGKASGGPRWDASLYSLNYVDLSENSLTQLLLGAALPGAAGQWHTDVRGQWQYALLQGNALQQIASVRLEGARHWPTLGTLRIGLTFSAIDALDENFAFIAGARQVLGASLARPSGSGQIQAGVVVERNDRDDLATAEEFYSFSPTRYGVWFQGSWPTGTRWRLEPTARYYDSRYADEERRADGLRAQRNDDEHELTLRARYRLTTDWEVLGEHTYLQHRSNFAEFSYTQRVTLFGVSRRLH